MEIKPMTGGFVRPFGTAWFIIEALKVNVKMHFTGPTPATWLRKKKRSESEMVDLPILKNSLQHDWSTTLTVFLINCSRCGMAASPDILGI